MASKSLTALPSIVSVMAEKSVVAMRCHTRGFEKVIWPVVCIVLTTLALVCYAVAAGTPMWVQIQVVNGTSTRGYINFGIFSGSHVVAYQERSIINTIEDSYFVFQKFTNILVDRLYAAFTFSIVAMLLCIILIGITFLNSYQTVTTWWKGPPMMYIISLITGLAAFLSLGIFVDFYLYDMNPQQVFIDSTSLNGVSYEYLLINASYQLQPVLHYSFGLHCIGSIIPILVLILSWRLVLLLPIRNYKTEEENPNDFEMRSNNEFSGSILPTNQMAMSMNAVASAPPMPIMHPGYVTGEGGLLY